MTGNIPHEIGNLTDLEQFEIHFNNFTGQIPKEIGNLTKLTYLTLDHNRLSGEIPNNMKNLTKLAKPHVDIGYNCLYTDDLSLIQWLNSVDPDWTDHQDQCPKGQLKVVDQQNGREWNINNILLKSEVEIDEKNPTFDIKFPLPIFLEVPGVR